MCTCYSLTAPCMHHTHTRTLQKLYCIQAIKYFTLCHLTDYTPVLSDVILTVYPSAVSGGTIVQLVRMSCLGSCNDAVFL